ncbi:MAG: hypothetical protein GY845_28390 [Planctomycetes bacterium]|nr:hypothetical protein [Planctomycetota bacterium]
MTHVQLSQGFTKIFAASGHEKTNPIYRGSCLVEASAKMEALSEDGFKPNFAVH